MASQKSHLTLQGPLNGVGYYKRNGKYFARTMPKYNQTGSQKKSANSASTLVRRNENMTEFARSAFAARQFTTGLNFLPRGMVNRPNLFAQFVKINEKILHLDTTGSRGNRVINIASHPEIFQDFLFSKKSLTAAFPNPATVTFNDGTASIHNPSGVLNFIPEGATHVRFVFCFLTASNVDDEGFVNEGAAGKISYQWSEYYPVTSAIPTYSVSLSAPADNIDDCAQIIVMGVEFSQDVNGTKYPLQEDMSACVIATNS